jgi:hypothetical protein
VEFVDSLTMGAHAGWRMARGGELVTLWQDWQDASIAEYGAEFFFDETTSADAGMGSRLFAGFPTVQIWDPDAAADHAFVWMFGRYSTDQGPTDKDTYQAFGWAVHDGDLANPAVPEPQTYALMLAGLLTLVLGVQRSAATGPRI